MRLRAQYDADLALARARGASSTPRATPRAPPRAAPPRPPPPKDTKTAKAWEEALRSDEWAQKLRKRAAEKAEAKADGDGQPEEEETTAEAEADEDEDEDEAIAEAVAAVEEAMRREREEVEAALRAVEAAEQSPRGSSAEVARTAELQLMALMELGFHAEMALPLCDGVSSVEELVEILMEQ